MNYDFKKSEEFLWFVSSAGGVFILQLLAASNLDKITDWKTWLIAAGAGLVRVVGGAGLAWVSRQQSAN